MKNSRIENSIRNAVHNAPVISAEELFAMPYVTMTEHDYITRQEPVQRKSNLARFSTAAAFCLVVLVMISGWYVQNRVPDSVITLDVNPSIEIRTNQKDEVLSVKALNEDAAVIVTGQKYTSSKLEDTVKSLIDSLVEHSYLSTDKNTILLTVMNKDSQKADALKNRMNAAIEVSLKAQDITPNIMSQVIQKEKNQTKQAENYGISQGKLELILDMLKYNDKFTIPMLAGKSMEELLELAEEYGMDLSGYLAYDNDASQEESGETGNSSEEGAQNSEDSNHENSDMENYDQENSNSENSDMEEGASEQGDSQEDEYKKDIEDSKDSSENQDNEDQNKESQSKEDQNQSKEDQNQSQEDQNQGKEDQNQSKEDQNQSQEDQKQGKEDQNQSKKDQYQSKEDQNQSKEDQNQSKNYESQGDNEEGSSIVNSGEKDTSDKEDGITVEEQEATLGEGDASVSQDSQLEEETQETSSVVENSDQSNLDGINSVDNNEENSDIEWTGSQEPENQYTEDSGNNELGVTSSDSNSESENTSENQGSEED